MGQALGVLRNRRSTNAITRELRIHCMLTDCTTNKQTATAKRHHSSLERWGQCWLDGFTGSWAVSKKCLRDGF